MLNVIDADKILTQALFLHGADRLEEKFLTDERQLAMLLVSALNLSCRDEASVSVMDSEPGVIEYRAKVGDNYGTHPVSRIVKAVAGANPDQARQYLAMQVSGLSEMISGYMQATGPLATLENLGAVVRSKKYSVERQLMGRDYVTWELEGDLVAVVGAKVHQTTAFTTREELTNLGLDEAKAKELALRNLKARLTTTPPVAHDTNSPSMLIDGFGGDVHSLLLLPDFLDALRVHLNDDLFIHAQQSSLVIMAQGETEELVRITDLAASGKLTSLSDHAAFFYDGERLSSLSAEQIDELRFPPATTRKEPRARSSLN